MSDPGGNPGASPFTADMRSYQNYYPFGMPQPGRVWNGDSARYGYNGKEKDNEVNGSGNEYDYGFRVYNPRLARFLSVDPLAPEYAELTPYQFASNTPLFMVDLDGREGKIPDCARRPYPEMQLPDADGNAMRSGSSSTGVGAQAEVRLRRGPMLTNSIAGFVDWRGVWGSIQKNLLFSAMNMITVSSYAPLPEQQITLQVGKFAAMAIGVYCNALKADDRFYAIYLSTDEGLETITFSDGTEGRWARGVDPNKASTSQTNPRDNTINQATMNLTSPHGTPIDAFRHGYWGALNGRDWPGESGTVTLLMNLREGVLGMTDHFDAETEQDKFNNGVSPRIGEQHPEASDGEIERIIINAIRTRVLAPYADDSRIQGRRH